MGKVKITPKRTKIPQKIWYILKPFLVYMLVKTFAMLFFAFAIPMLPIRGIDVWIESVQHPLSAVINAMASLIAVYFLLEDFLKEVAVSGEVDIDAGILKQFWQFVSKGFFGYGKKEVGKLAVCALLGIVSAFLLNSAVSFYIKLFQMSSEKYQEVETIQYSVPLWLGILLYGVIAPLVEEIVFRGILYNRMRRFFGIPCCALLSALLFGLFHGNLPQFVYGTCMGILIALSYEKVKCFGAPFLFHMAANLSVFLYAFV